MNKNHDQNTPHVTKDMIKRGLAEVGIQEGDVALVHSSLSSFGYVEGGAETVIDALLEAVGPPGTIVMPAFTWDPHDKESGVYDVANTPVDRSIGRIPEAFRRRPDSIRSLHICHSVCAAGPHAEDIMGNGVTVFGSESPFDRLWRLDARSLFLGVGFLVCTSFHLVEERFNVPYRMYRDFKGFTMILPNGREIPCRSMENLRKEGYENDFPKMDEILPKENILKVGRIGNAKIMNAKIRDIVKVTSKYMEEDIGFLLTPQSRDRLREEYGL